MNCFRVLCFVVPALFTVPALAETFYVSPGQNIQLAIDDAQSGDVIEFAPGLYGVFTSLDLGDKDLTLQSAAGRDDTTLDAFEIGESIFKLAGGQTTATVIDGFTIRRGMGTLRDGYIDTVGGAFYLRASDVTIRNCIVEENHVTGSGGAIFSDDIFGQSVVYLQNTVFRNNTAADGCGAIDGWNTALWIGNCSFENNSGSPLIDVYHATVSATDTTFTGNSGGALRIGFANVSLTNCHFTDNTGTQDGGAIFVSQIISFNAVNCTFTGNSTEGSGGAVASDSPMVFTDCEFRSNTADVDGDGDGGAIAYSAMYGNLTVWSTHFCGNTPNHISGDYVGGGNTFAAVCDNPCPGDTNGSGTVDVVDIVNVILDWGSNGSVHGGDVNGSGSVNVVDLTEVILAWGSC